MPHTANDLANDMPHTANDMPHIANVMFLTENDMPRNRTFNATCLE